MARQNPRREQQLPNRQKHAQLLSGKKTLGTQIGKLTAKKVGRTRLHHRQKPITNRIRSIKQLIRQRVPRPQPQKIAGKGRHPGIAAKKTKLQVQQTLGHQNPSKIRRKTVGQTHAARLRRQKPQHPHRRPNLPLRNCQTSPRSVGPVDARVNERGTLLAHVQKRKDKPPPQTALMYLASLHPNRRYYINRNHLILLIGLRA